MKYGGIFKRLLALGILAFPVSCLATSGPVAGNDEPPFEWDDAFASANTSLSLEETKRVPLSKGETAIWYRIKAVGFPSNERYSLWVKRGLRYFKRDASVTSDGVVEFKPATGNDTLAAIVILAFHRDEGVAVVHASSGTNAMLMAGFADGHPLSIALVSGSSGKRAHAKAVPIPLRAEGAGGCSVSAELQSESGFVFLILAKGFAPGEAVQLQSRYKKEVKNDTKPASQLGDITLPIMFGAGDKGAASFTATTSKCSAKLEYKVGKDALVH